MDKPARQCGKNRQLEGKPILSNLFRLVDITPAPKGGKGLKNPTHFLFTTTPPECPCNMGGDYFPGYKDSNP